MSYNKKIWANGDLITKEGLNNIEDGIYDAHDKINTINNKVENNTNDTNTARQDISDIKLQIGTEELTTTSKKIKGAINDLSSQIKDIVNYSIDNIYELNNVKYKINDIVELKGYYEKGDSNKHLRIIESKDDGSGIKISNNLFANILHSGVVECEWFGVICKNENDYRNTEMQKFLNYIKIGKAKKFNLGSNDIYLNEPMELVFNSTGGGFTIESNGAKMIFTLTEEKPCLKIGLDTTSYSSLSNVTLRNIEIKANGNQSHGLKLYTNGMNTLAFWNSLFENIKVSVNKGKGVGIYNGVFECRFKGLRIDHKRKSKENEDGVLLTSDDIGLYLANEPNNNIISSLQFDYVNIWGGYHSIKTEGLNGRYAPDFSCNECHVFDSKMEALLLQNQQHYNYLKKVHMEFIGTTENPVWGIKWIGYGMIDGVEGGSDGLLGFVRVHNGYKNVMRVNNLATPLALNSNSKGYLFPHTETGGNIETDCELSNIHIPDYCTGTLICNVNGRKATVKLTGNSKRLDIILNTENGVTYTKNEGIDNNAIYTNINAYGIYGGKTNTTDMDFSNKSNVIRYDLGHGVQNNVKLGFYGQSPIQKPVIQGSDGGNLALRQLLSALSLLGLIDNSTSQG